jgi:hypothetical protein
VPRRTRVPIQQRRKRLPPPVRGRSAPQPAAAPEDAEAPEPAAAVPYIARRTDAVTSVGRTSELTRVPPVRQARALITDYGYVMSELERVGLTFGGLILLLVIVSRILR